MLAFLKNFKATIIVGIICLILAFIWGIMRSPEQGIVAGFSAIWIASILAIFECTMSLDNAVVNASILKHWDKFWKMLFLTVGILIAVFGMRLVFPVLIVSITADLSMMDTVSLALNNPVEYSTKLLENHISIAAFGGMFLWLVFANFLFDQEKETFWLGKSEELLAKLGSIPFVAYLSSIMILLSIYCFVPLDMGNSIVYAGMVGIGIYAGVQLLGWILEKFTGSTEEESEANGQLATGAIKAGIGGFLYLELLDASFSFDGVVGAFAITNDIVIIMLGLTIGAIAVRCLTIYLVNEGTLDNYRYLEHGAMYAIGVLALILLCSGFVHLPEIVTGLIGVLIIGVAFYQSIQANKKETLNTTT